MGDNDTTTVTQLRAYRLCLDPTDTQLSVLQQHAGSNRWAFNQGHSVLRQQWEAYNERQQAHAEKISGLTGDELAKLSKTERRKVNDEAKKIVRAENTALCADLTVIDDHRKRVVHKGKPTLQPGDSPGPDASATAHRLYLRRLELAELQQALVIEHLNSLGTSDDLVGLGHVPGESNETIVLPGATDDNASEAEHELHQLRSEIREHQLRRFDLGHRLYLQRIKLAVLQQTEILLRDHRDWLTHAFDEPGTPLAPLAEPEPHTPLLALFAEPDDNASEAEHELHQQRSTIRQQQIDMIILAHGLYERRLELAKLQEQDTEAYKQYHAAELNRFQQVNTSEYKQYHAAELNRFQLDSTQYKQGKKAELDNIRPQVLKLKKDLIAEGAYRPTSMDLATLWRTTRDLPKEDGGSPWHDQVSPYTFTSGFGHADTAWKNWMDSATGKRAGRRVGMPRFKKKGRAKDSFTLFHDVKNPGIRPDGYRRVNLPGIGSIRVHDNTKRLVRVLNQGRGHVKSVTVSRGAHKWYASVLVEVTFTPPAPTRTQQANGRVGVNFGVHHLATLSTGEIIDNPRHLDKASRDLKKAQQAVSRSHANGVKESGKLTKKRAKLARRHHELSEQREGHLHQLTKRLTTTWEEVAIQDLDLIAMTRSARGTVDKPGTGVKRKAKLNRDVLDASFGKARQILEYKGGTNKKINRQEQFVPGWYGSVIAITDRFEPIGQTCATCGATRAKLSPSQRVFTCPTCGVSRNRDLNEALNTKATAVAPDRGLTLNARGDHGSPQPSGDEAAVSETGRPSG